MTEHKLLLHSRLCQNNSVVDDDYDEFEDGTFEYDCIGITHTKNRARVHNGILQKRHKFFKYIVVAKVGLPEEATTSAKPGNRRKRDSQLQLYSLWEGVD